MSNLNFCATWGTPKIMFLLNRLQYRLLSFTYACCTNIMKGFACLHRRLENISKRPGWELKKTIALQLTFPIFKFHLFFFKLAYAIGEKQLFLVTGQRDTGCFHQLCVNLADCGNKLIVIRKMLGSRKQFLRGGEVEDE